MATRLSPKHASAVVDRRVFETGFIETSYVAMNDADNALWMSRLQMFRHAKHQNTLFNQLKEFLKTVVIICAAMLCFLAGTEFSIHHNVFLSMICFMFVSATLIPVFSMLCNVSSEKVISMSRRFYSSDHEVEIGASHLSLIDRGTNKVVVTVPIFDAKKSIESLPT